MSESAPDAGPSRFAVLCICEGNLCRSPAAQLLLGDALGDGVVVTSEGTRAVVGAPVAPGMAPLLDARGIAHDGFRSRQLQPADVRAADLVLTMTTAQRRQVVERVPAAVRRTFTLRELARLVSDVEPDEIAAPDLGERFRRVLPAAAARRRFTTDPAGDDIADPWGRDEAAYRRAFDEVATAVDQLVAVLRP